MRDIIHHQEAGPIMVKGRGEYRGGWRYCSKCVLAFRPALEGVELNRCPLCGTLLRTGPKTKNRKE